ncbi:BTAD domain-containing putative transcriptional regulator [Jongsikchunia kroppenstedtii]|uniref:BTAD domain-containing putative transcriptional regulator n=1 Tax=Jongsikchunia kroppenstedtii TaxID=1121721 RepID=UPI00036F0C24|nr:BTAD domain-containing putative transcriptional regulator [Jongsikchunia kroppenstedtii]
MSQQSVLVRLLGPVGVVDPDGDIKRVPGARARTLLAALAVEPGQFRSAARLIDTVWGDDQPQSPQAALHTQISRLRPLLPADALEAGPGGYRLAVEPTAVDLYAVQSLIADGTDDSLRAARKLWRGEPGADLGNDDLAGEIRRHADQLLSDLDDRLSRTALADGDFEAARRLAEARCAADPLDEPAHATLMRALAGLGRTSDALAVFARIRRVLSAELGTDPGPELVALNNQLLTADSGEAAPPPAKPVSAVGIRAEPNELIGRDKDLADITELLKRHRVVTVLGPGGAGKTRIANSVGHAAASAGDPVFLVELASVRDGGDVMVAVSATLGIGESDLTPAGRARMVFGDLTQRLADALGGRPTLVILDNCEHLVDACAQAAADLVGAAPNITVLATSRSPLQIASETVYELPPLLVDESGSAATDLFLQRARSIRPDARFDLAEVAQLCRELDGLPLAIELAAARIRTMTVADIRAGLAQRFALLRSGDRASPTRHRTLHAVIDWSWDLLDDPAREALRRLCRFPGGFTLDAARTVCGTTGFDLDDRLSALVNQSLLQVAEIAEPNEPPTVRYRMLEMVREYGEEQLAASGEGREVDSAMTRWAVELTARLRADYEQRLRQREAVRAVARELDNLVWVLRRCTDPDRSSRPDDHQWGIVSAYTAISAFWALRGLHHEVIAWAPQILGALDSRDARSLTEDERELYQGAYLIALGHLFWQGDKRQIAVTRTRLRRLLRPELTLLRQADFISSILLSRNPTQAMRTICRGMLSEVEDVRMTAAMVRTNARENLGNHAGAMADAQLALQWATERGDLWMIAMTTTGIGGLHGQRAHYRDAVESYRRGLALMVEIGAEEDSRQVRGYLLTSLLGLGDVAAAREIYGDVTRGWTPDQPDPQGHPETVATILMSSAELARADGRLEQAAELYRRCIDNVVANHEGIGRDPFVSLVMSNAVCALAVAGRADAAAPYVGTLAAIVGRLHAPGGSFDIPQTGTIALACGAVICAGAIDAPNGAGPRLLALSQRLPARLDYPALRDCAADAGEASGLGAAQWDSLAGETCRISRTHAVREILTLLKPLAD